MNRDEQILELIPLARDFSKRKSRGRPQVEEEIFSRLCEILTKRLEKGDIQDPERYFRKTFDCQSRGFFRDLDVLEKRNNFIANNIRTKKTTTNGAVDKLLLEDALSLVDDEEKELIRMRIEGYSNREIAGKLGVSLNRLAAVTVKIKEKIRAKY